MDRQEKDSVNLESILDSSDPGDDTLLRFRYQVSYAGILSIFMVDDTEDIIEVFCEHHEDVLVKHKGGAYTGVQVKTRDINLSPFIIEDDAILNSFEKFTLLNKNFKDQFRHFSIVSNAGFDKTKPAVCINTLIDNVKKGVDVLKPRSKSKVFIDKIAKSCNCSTDCVLDTIKKARTRTFCSLEDIHMHLINALKNCSLLKGSTESKIESIADAILAKHFKASSLHNSFTDITTKYVLGIFDEEAEAGAVIKSKCIEKSEFIEWLLSEKDNSVTILLKDRDSISNIPNGHRRLEIKMDAGRVDSENIDLVRDFKFSFEQHVLSWIYKTNVDEAEGKYNQVLAVTQNLCKEVYDEEKIAEKENGGLPMLIQVRKRIRERKNSEPNIFFDCSHEHIIGAVGVLTESCKVWWGAKFDIKE